MHKLVMTSPNQLPPTHEELFVRQYKLLFGWALRLTNNDRQRAEDLVQDAFVQFTFAKPDLNNIENLDGYLYGMLRNLYLLDLRRANRNQTQSLSAIDFDSAEIGLRMRDIRLQFQTQEELHRICYYACQRKKSSKAGSALLLRFFHGYYPNEIALILRVSRPAVSELLRLARTEAKLFLENPSALGFIADPVPPDTIKASFAATSDKLLYELRQIIYRSCRGECLSSRNLKQIYLNKERSPIDSQLLEHIASCCGCLDNVNRILGLPLLAERCPIDSLGPDQRSKGGPDNSDGGQSGGSGDLLGKLRRKAKQIFEHRPRQLCISVNGDIQVWQTINSAISEQTVSLEETERVDLVDVTSEQGLRLLYLSVNQTEAGPVEQAAVVGMSENRTLQVKLDHSGLRPQLHVLYCDPSFSSEELIDLQSEQITVSNSRPHSDDQTEYHTPARNKTWDRLFSWKFWLSPATVTALIAIILIIAVVMFHRLPVPVAPLTLLSESSSAESKIAAVPDRVIHRTINFEQHDSMGSLILRRRLEIWETAGNADAVVKVRSVFDESDLLIGAEWIKGNGSAEIYRSGGKVDKQSDDLKLGSRSLAALLETNSIWLLDPSAKNFLSLMSQAENTQIEERQSNYIVNYRSSVTTGDVSGFHLIKASLVLNKSDLHATELSFQLNSGNNKSDKSALTEYTFTESRFEQRPTSAIPPTIFEPDPVLLRSMGNVSDKANADHPDRLQNAVSAAVLASTELEILDRLNEINALSGDQVRLTRTSEGKLQVQGIVETEKRKSEFLRALASFRNNTAVKIEIETAAEAARRNRSRAKSETISGETVDVDSERIPVDAELHDYFARTKGLSGVQLDQEVHTFAERTLEQSRQARRRAMALKQMAEQFSLDDLRNLDPASYARWRTMIRSQAARVNTDLRGLHISLSPIFPGYATGANAGTEAPNNAEIIQESKRLFELISSCDEAVSRSFSIYTGQTKTANVKIAEFWKSLSNAEALAEHLANSR